MENIFEFIDNNLSDLNKPPSSNTNNINDEHKYLIEELGWTYLSSVVLYKNGKLRDYINYICSCGYFKQQPEYEIREKFNIAYPETDKIYITRSRQIAANTVGTVHCKKIVVFINELKAQNCKYISGNQFSDTMSYECECGEHMEKSWYSIKKEGAKCKLCSPSDIKVADKKDINIHEMISKKTNLQLTKVTRRRGKISVLFKCPKGHKNRRSIHDLRNIIKSDKVHKICARCCRS